MCSTKPPELFLRRQVANSFQADVSMHDERNFMPLSIPSSFIRRKITHPGGRSRVQLTRGE